MYCLKKKYIEKSLIPGLRALTPVWPVAPGVRGWVEEGGAGRTHELAVYALGRRSWPNVFVRDTQKTEAVSTGWETAPPKVGV